METKITQENMEATAIDTITWRRNSVWRRFIKTTACATLVFFLGTHVDSRWLNVRNTAHAQEANGAQPTQTEQTTAFEKPAEQEEATQTTQHLPAFGVEQIPSHDQIACRVADRESAKVDDGMQSPVPSKQVSGLDVSVDPNRSTVPSRS